MLALTAAGRDCLLGGAPGETWVERPVVAVALEGRMLLPKGAALSQQDHLHSETCKIQPEIAVVKCGTILRHEPFQL